MTEQPTGSKRSLLWAAALLSITAAATHSLLMVHLTCAASAAQCTDDPHASDPPAHDHAHCLFCQQFNGIGNKSLCGLPDACPLTEAAALAPVIGATQAPLDCDLPRAVPRAPPSA